MAKTLQQLLVVDTVGMAGSSRTKDPESIEIIPLSLQELYNNDITNALYITYNI